MHRFVSESNLSWSHGVLFEHGKTRVLVETTRTNEIVFRSRGPEKKALLSVIASDLDALNKSFRGLKGKVHKWVPCTCGTCSALADPQMFEINELLDRKHRGKATIECSKPPSYDDVSVIELLDGMRLEEWLDVKLSTDGEREDDAGDPPTAPLPAQPPGLCEKTVRIFLASSAELREDRDAFDLYFRRQNDRLRGKGFYLRIVRWEDFLDQMSKTRKQDDYNRAIRECDLFVSLFKTKTGKYTEEEFDVAHRTFESTGKPLIYTYFRKSTEPASRSNRDDLNSLWTFQEKLEELGHFHTEYESIEGLQGHFRDQLDKLRDSGAL